MLSLTENRIKTVRLPSGHMPMLSMPEKLADILLREADEVFVKDY